MSYLERLEKIKAFVFDVDGVLTDGSVYLLPGGNMCRVMHVLDGYAIVKALKSNYKIGVITGGNDEMVKHRVHYLGIQDYYPKTLDKLQHLEHFRNKYGLQPDEILCMGDDLPDIPILKASGISTCPANAVAEIKDFVDYISPVHGGKGAVRDVIEQTLKAQRCWIQDDTQSI